MRSLGTPISLLGSGLAAHPNATNNSQETAKLTIAMKQQRQTRRRTSISAVQKEKHARSRSERAVGHGIGASERRSIRGGGAAAAQLRKGSMWGGPSAAVGDNVTTQTLGSDVFQAAAKWKEVSATYLLPTPDDLRSLHALCASPAVSVDYLKQSLAMKPAGAQNVLRGYYALHHLAANFCANGEMIEVLVQANPYAVCEVDELKRTPLHWLCRSLSVDTRGLRAMVNAKATVDSCNGLDFQREVIEAIEALAVSLADVDARIIEAVCSSSAVAVLETLKLERTALVRQEERLRMSSPTAFAHVKQEEVWVGLVACLAEDGGYQLPIHSLCQNPSVSHAEGEAVSIMLFQDFLTERPAVLAEIDAVGLNLTTFDVGTDADSFWTSRSADPEAPAVHHISVYDKIQPRGGNADVIGARPRVLLDYVNDVRSIASARGGWGSLTPLHLVCANVHASANVVRRCIVTAPHALVQMDAMGRLPLHHLCARVPLPDVETLATVLAASPSTGIVADLRGHTALHLLAQSPVLREARRAADPALLRSWALAPRGRGARVSPAGADLEELERDAMHEHTRQLYEMIGVYTKFCPQGCMEVTASGRTPLHDLCANIALCNAQSTPCMSSESESAKELKAMSPVISTAAIKTLLRVQPSTMHDPDANGMTPIDILLENGAVLYHSAGGLREYFDVFGIGNLALQEKLPRFMQHSLAGVREAAARKAQHKALSPENRKMGGKKSGFGFGQLKRLGAMAVRQPGNIDSIDIGLRNADMRGASFEEATAARLHAIWQEARRLPTDDVPCSTHTKRDRLNLPRLEFEPRCKLVNGVMYDIANLNFWELPVMFRHGNIEPAKFSCACVRTAWAAESDLGAEFVEKTAAGLHAAWVTNPENRKWATAAQLKRYADLSEEEKNKDRVIASAAVDVWYDRGHRRRGSAQEFIPLAPRSQSSKQHLEAASPEKRARQLTKVGSSRGGRRRFNKRRSAPMGYSPSASMRALHQPPSHSTSPSKKMGGAYPLLR